MRHPAGGEIFRTRPDGPWGPPSLLYNGYRISFPGLKRLGRGVNHTPLSNAEVKERVELYHYFPSGPSWPVVGRNLLLYVPEIKYSFESVKMIYSSTSIAMVSSAFIVLFSIQPHI